MATDCDYVVVGAGAAGCVLAARLSENPANRVILLEAGRPDNILFRVPGLGFAVPTFAGYNWNFTTEPIPALDDRRLTLFAGKVLGGSSSINGMMYSRGHSLEYDAWAAMGCDGWDFAGVLPYFRKAESNVRGASKWHGDSGPLRVKPANPRLRICDAFLEAAAEAGFPIVDDINADVVDGFGYCDVNVDRGRRMSTASVYLRPARKRKNLTVLTQTQALRVAFDRNRACGVEIVHRGRRRIISCEREVIVSSGGIKSPHLLLLSGIGPADHLRALGVPVVADSANVGKNLQNHACYRPQYACSAPVTAYQHLKPANALKAGIEYALFRSGPLGESFVSVGGVFRSDDTLKVPDVQVAMVAALVTLPKNPKAWQLLPNEEGFSLTIFGTPFSRGEVRLRSADPLEHPIIDANYFADRRDIEILVRATERMREIARRPVLRQFIRAELQPGEAVAGAASLERVICRNAANSYHPVGTCAMGGSGAVVDPQLRVRGVEGLRVADNSVLPLIPNSGLHAPAIMVGEKAAAMILGAATA